MPSIQSVLTQALESAGHTLMSHYGKLELIDKKGDIDLVTAADRASEETIKAVITGQFPTHAILAEETGSTPGEEHTWVIDPLDGTTNFAHGFPCFSISIAVMREGLPVAAGVLNPFYGETFLAER